MTDCEQCPMWGKDSNGEWGCTTHYCIENPMAAIWQEQDIEQAYCERERESMLGEFM